MTQKEITPKELKVKLDAGEPLILIDVREPSEVAICTLPHSKLIPLGEFASRAGEIDKDKETIIYCRSGGRSGNAVQYLRGLGYTNIKNLEGGILRWSDDVDPSVTKY